MTVVKLFRDFYLYLKENRKMKEEHWHCEKSNTHIHFGHKRHLLDVYVFLKSDKRTYVVQSEGTKNIKEEEWDWLFSQLKLNEKDVLFIFQDEEILKDNIKTVATGKESEKMKELYDGLIQFYKPSHIVSIKTSTDWIIVPIRNRSNPVHVYFDWDSVRITIEDQPRRLNKTFGTVKEIKQYVSTLKK